MAYEAQKSRRGFAPNEVLKLHGCGVLFTIKTQDIISPLVRIMAIGHIVFHSYW